MSPTISRVTFASVPAVNRTRDEGERRKMGMGTRSAKGVTSLNSGRTSANIGSVHPNSILVKLLATGTRYESLRSIGGRQNCLPPKKDTGQQLVKMTQAGLTQQLRLSQPFARTWGPLVSAIPRRKTRCILPCSCSTPAQEVGA